MKRVAAVSLALAAAMAMGCAGRVKSVSLTPPSPVTRVDAINLWAVPPVAINWDDMPGPDGVQVNVFLYQADRAAPVLMKGMLEFSMYEGRHHADALREAKPLRTWTYTEQELATRQVRGIAGWGYGIQLGWGLQVPDSDIITLVACYRPPKGAPIYSSPIIIAVSK